MYTEFVVLDASLLLGFLAKKFGFPVRKLGFPAGTPAFQPETSFPIENIWFSQPKKLGILVGKPVFRLE